MPPTKTPKNKANKANPHDAKKKTTTPVETPRKPWEYQVILQKMAEERGHMGKPNHYSASDLFNLYTKLREHWDEHINKAIYAIHYLHEYIQLFLKTVDSRLDLTSAHPENSNSYVEHITLTPELKGDEKVEKEVEVINNFLNNLHSRPDLIAIKDDINREHLQHIRNYELVSDEKTKLENLEWIMDGPGNLPKRIQSYGKFEDGSDYITMGIVKNGLVRDYEDIALPDDTPVFTMYAENPDNEVTDYDSDDSDDEQDGGKKRRIQRTPTNKRNTKKKNTKRKHANNGGADDSQKNPPSPSALPGSPVEQVANTNNPQQQQQQLQQLQQQIHGLYAQIQELQQQQPPPPEEEASDSRTPGGKPKAKMSKTKKRRCKKSSKTKKRNMKRYHNANTKTNRKKRVP